MKYLWITILTVLLAGPTFGEGGPNQYGAFDNLNQAQEAYRQLYNSFTPEQKRIENLIRGVFAHTTSGPSRFILLSVRPST